MLVKLWPFLTFQSILLDCNPILYKCFLKNSKSIRCHCIINFSANVCFQNVSLFVFVMDHCSCYRKANLSLKLHPNRINRLWEKVLWYFGNYPWGNFRLFETFLGKNSITCGLQESKDFENILLQNFQRN